MITTYRMKIKLFKEGLKEQICESCRGTTWFGVQIPLELHHIDGDVKNNELSNLRILCPNCHSLTINHRGKNKKRKERTIVSDETIIEIIKTSYTKREALLKAGLTGYGSSYHRINNVMEKYSVNLLVKEKDPEVIQAQLKRIETLRAKSKSISVLYRKIEWPSKEVLEKLLFEKPVTHIGKELGVSDNAVRKAARRLGIDLRSISKWAQRHGSVR